MEKLLEVSGGREMNDLSVYIDDQENLGCHLKHEEATFKIYAQRAFAMVLEVYQDANKSTPLFKQVIERVEDSDFFSASVPEAKNGMYYVWRIMYEDYSYSPSIMDPYAKGVIYFQGEWRNLIVSKQCYKVKKPQIPWNQSILYELHVGHFTRLDPSIPSEERGTFKGLMRKLPYFKQLGITTLELMPIFKWHANTLKNINPQTDVLLEDVWGYNPLAFFSLDERYSVEKTSEASLREFRDFIEAAHHEKIEIILDVVYNHTGEGGEDGVAIHFKYLAPEVYYKYNEQHKFLNCAGTGNTLNTNHPIVKKLIKESLTYWANEVGVDGFRFDLASILGQDEKGRWLKESLLNEIAGDIILSKVKLISESWDAKGSYDVGRMPAPFCEWSDYFRDTIRKFIKGDQGIVSAVSACMMGKEIYFTDTSKGKDQTIHFITAHDGFTMWDLVTYNQKHNESNGENNRDGHNANYSYNWGFEGETQQEDINHRRRQVVKNLMCLLLLSKGTPMLLMGDEFGRTQKGNNNAFCQDNELVWVDWSKTKENSDLLDFTSKVIAIRKQLRYFKDEEPYEVSWHGVHYKQPDWSYYSCSIACYIEGKESLFFISNNYHEALNFELPAIKGKWCCIINTASQDAFKEGFVEEKYYEVKAYSICLFKVVEEV